MFSLKILKTAGGKGSFFLLPSKIAQTRKLGQVRGGGAARREGPALGRAPARPRAAAPGGALRRRRGPRGFKPLPFSAFSFSFCSLSLPSRRSLLFTTEAHRKINLVRLDFLLHLCCHSFYLFSLIAQAMSLSYSSALLLQTYNL